MSKQKNLKEHVEALQQCEQIVLDTDSDIQNRTFTVYRVEPSERHYRDGDQHYRVYLRGTGNEKGQGTYVINRDFATWSRRQRDHTAPELFYIDDVTSPSGMDERTEGAVTAIR